MDVVRVNVVREPGAEMPRYAHPGEDAGADLVCIDRVSLAPGTGADVRTGLHIEPEQGFWCRIVGRSSTLRKRGLLIGEGIIDQGYRGPLFVYAYNPGNKPVTIERGERLAQLIFARVITAAFDEVEELGESARGSNGFGSTGV